MSCATRFTVELCVGNKVETNVDPFQLLDSLDLDYCEVFHISISWVLHL